MRRPRYGQRGLGLATALFVITVMALLAVLVTQLITSNAQAVQEEVGLIRAFYSAETGVQFGLNTLYPPDGTAGSCPAGPVGYSLGVAGLDACDVDVSCSSVTVSSTNYYTITSTGTCGDVSRTIQIRAQ